MRPWFSAGKGETWQTLSVFWRRRCPIGSRLRILECIQKGVSNPGDLARKLDRHTSTVEKHLRVLPKAGTV